MSTQFPPPPPPMPPMGQGAGGWAQPPGEKPSNNLALAILSTILCCLPLGIVSIVYAAKVDGHWMAGRYAEAADASRKAKSWAIASIISIVVVSVLFVLFAVVLGSSEV